MKTEEFIKRTPWDSAVFGLETYEIQSVSVEVLEQVVRTPGHYTAKVAPLSSRKLLHDYGFYYCDTLLEPFCSRERLIFHYHKSIGMSRDVPLEKLLAVCHGAFDGRFHKDFNISRELADRRYDNWLKQLYEEKNVYGLMFGDDLAGFIGLSGGRLVLHAVAERFRGRGIAKFLWSAACLEFFEQGYEELTSSISAANVAAINLYVSLGFRFRNPKDIYHRLTT